MKATDPVTVAALLGEGWEQIADEALILHRTQVAFGREFRTQLVVQGEQWSIMQRYGDTGEVIGFAGAPRTMGEVRTLARVCLGVGE